MDEKWKRLAAALPEEAIDDDVWAKLANDNGVEPINQILKDDKSAQMELFKMLKKDKDFSEEEKMILSLLMGFPPTLRMIAAAMKLSFPGVKKIIDRAKARIDDGREALAKEGDAYQKHIKWATADAQAAQKDGRYNHGGNVIGMKRPGWDYDHDMTKKQWAALSPEEKAAWEKAHAGDKGE